MTTAVLITGNPVYIQGNKNAAKFYANILNYLESQGVKAVLDPGLPHSSPPEADIWIGHSRGKDRLRYAPQSTKVLALGALSEPGIPAVSHPFDNTAFSSHPAGIEPNQYHYVFTPEMRYAINRLIQRRPVHSITDPVPNTTKVAGEAAKDLELWHTWKANPTPDTLAPLFAQINPIIINEANKWKQSGLGENILQAHGRSLAYEALQSYTPGKSQLNTHITNHLKKLSRYTIQNQNAIRVNEEKIYDYRKFMTAKQELQVELNRDPSMMELQDRVGVGRKLSDFKPTIEHFYSKASEAGAAPVMEELSSDAVALRMAYSSLTPKQKQVFEHSYGYNGAEVQSNKALAKSLGVSEAAVSKQKNQIDKVVTEHVQAGRYLLHSI